MLLAEPWTSGGQLLPNLPSCLFIAGTPTGPIRQYQSQEHMRAHVNVDEVPHQTSHCFCCPRRDRG
ncbi:hypothetical protein JMJ77_0010938, partial [Colletotrichum scovillei]